MRFRSHQPGTIYIDSIRRFTICSVYIRPNSMGRATVLSKNANRRNLIIMDELKQKSSGGVGKPLRTDSISAM